jgi:hypothetical protein
MEKPLILEFDSPIKGTFPLWYDPAYWYAGAKLRFDLRQQVTALRAALREYQNMFFQAAVFLSGSIVLCILAVREKRFCNLSLRESWLLTWPLTAMLMYAFVFVEGRYVGAFLVLLWLAIYGALMFRLNRQVAAAVCATVAGTVMIPFLADLAAKSPHIARDLVRSRQPDYQAVAVGLRNLGLHSGDRLAVVGEGFESYYARYARLRIVAEIPGTDEFWKLSALDLNSAAERLATIGVKAIVAKNRPDIFPPANWRDVEASDSVRFSVLLLPEPLTKIR